MTLINTKRLLKSGITNFFRNIWVSIAATSMVAITLFIISTMIILYVLAFLSVQNSTEKVGVITAYFSEKTTEKEMMNVKAEIEQITGVKQVDYVSKDEARKRFEEKHKDNPALLEGLNQFVAPEYALAASLAIRADSLQAYPNIYKEVNSDRYKVYFDKVRNTQDTIDKLNRIIEFIQKFGVLLAAIFMFVTIMVTFNTIRLTIYNRREEVEIMRLVGATNWYIRWPFLIEGILYALFAVIITSLIVLGLLILLSSRIEQFLSLNSLGTSLIRAIFWRILLTNLVASVLLTVFASAIAMRRYLRI